MYVNAELFLECDGNCVTSVFQPGMQQFAENENENICKCTLMTLVKKTQASLLTYPNTKRNLLVLVKDCGDGLGSEHRGFKFRSRVTR